MHLFAHFYRPDHRSRVELNTISAVWTPSVESENMTVTTLNLSPTCIHQSCDQAASQHWPCIDLALTQSLALTKLKSASTLKMLRQQLIYPTFLFFLWISTSSALHFYLDATDKRCFVEELPSDTVVEGMACPKISYTVETYLYAEL